MCVVLNSLAAIVVHVMPALVTQSKSGDGVSLYEVIVELNTAVTVALLSWS
jgi:hypothetical protein